MYIYIHTKDEKSALKLQVGKQRGDIVMKAKAATAGWYVFITYALLDKFMYFT
jgi:hypothetical protein